MDEEQINQYNLIRENPRDYILKWSDNVLVITGRRAFDKLMYFPHTIQLPEIPFNSNPIRSNTSVMGIGGVSVGKTTIAKKLNKLSLNPVMRKRITAADLRRLAMSLGLSTILIDDISQIANEDYNIIKVLEGIIGEDKAINSSTKTQGESLGEVKAIAFIGITPIDLEKFSDELEAGLFSRCVVLYIETNQEEQKKINNYIALGAGEVADSRDTELMENTVVDFYQELRMIQQGEHNLFLEEKFGKNHNRTIIQPIKGYKIEKEFKEKLANVWNKITDKVSDDGETIPTRHLHEYFRFLISSAFLNIHKREHKDNILVPNIEDHKIALRLAIDNAQYKWALSLAFKANKKANSIDNLKEILEGNSYPPIVKKILINISPFGYKLKENNFEIEKGL